MLFPFCRGDRVAVTMTTTPRPDRFLIGELLDYDATGLSVKSTEHGGVVYAPWTSVEWVVRL